jgi:hypothetical protein
LAILRALAGLAAGLLLGLAISWVVALRPVQVPPPPSASQPAAGAPALPVTAPAPSAGIAPSTEIAAARPALSAAGRAAGVPPVDAAADPAEDATVLVPGEALPEAAPSLDYGLLRRGPGQYARILLEAAGVSSLAVRQGQMTRDGGQWQDFARNPVAGILRGKEVEIELLHVAFDREGRPVMAHIRTLGEPPIEGVVALRSKGTYIDLGQGAPEAEPESP